MDKGSSKDESKTESEGKKEHESIEEPKEPKTPTPQFVVPDLDSEEDEAKRSSILKPSYRVKKKKEPFNHTSYWRCYC